MRNRITGVIAPKGSGKTFHTSNSILQAQETVAVFDMLREPAYGMVATHIVTDSPAIFAETLRTAQPSDRIVYRPGVFQIKDGQEYCPEFPWFCRLCYLKGNVTIVVDEAHQLCTAHNIPDELAYIVRLGRHRGVSLWYITQSFSEISRTLTKNTDEFFFFRVIEPADLEGIRLRCGPDVRERVAGLRKLEWDGDRPIPGEIVRWNVWNGLEET